jgi:hypothetical protein
VFAQTLARFVSRSGSLDLPAFGEVRRKSAETSLDEKHSLSFPDALVSGNALA